MKTTKEAFLIIISLVLILGVSFSLWFLKTDRQAQILAYSNVPEWDIRGMDVTENYIRTRGDIAEYVPNQLLTPTEFEAADEVLTGYPINSAEAMTTRYRILVEPDHAYGILFMDADFATRIYINGVLMEEIGRPAESREEMIPQTHPVSLTVVAEDGVIEVVQQISNFVHRSGGNATTLYIGSPDSIRLLYLRTAYATVAIMGCCLLLFLVHLTLFAFLSLYRANLYFALFCFVWFFRVSVIGIKVLPSLFPQLSWFFFFRLEYISIPLAGIFLLLALNATFPGLIHRRWVQIVFIVTQALFVVLFMFADTVWMSHALLYNQISLLILATYILLRFLLQLRQRTIEHSIIFCSLLVLVYAMIRDTLFHNNIYIFPLGSPGFLDFALLVFIFFQMVATFAGTMRQVRAAKEAEQRLALEKTILEELNRMKNELITTVSHEIRTPLTVMSVYAQLAVKALRKENFDDRTTSDLQTISQEAERLADMASKLLTMFNDNCGLDQQVELSIAELLQQVVNLFAPLAETNANKLSLSVPAELPLVYGNADSLAQVVWNLLTNAVTHTKQGEIWISAEHTAENVIVHVKDNGSGIAPDLLPHVFERHVHGSNGSSGLGLAICKEIMESQGGDIAIESILGEGTTVTIAIPIAKEIGRHG